MKAITLYQPYAQAAVTRHPTAEANIPIKSWETRGFKPGEKTLQEIQKEGLLIHTSKNMDSMELLRRPPFSDYLPKYNEPLEFGVVVGWVKIGRILSTERWKGEFAPNGVIPMHKGSLSWEAYHFGDFSDGRYAWELLEPYRFETPIPYKGSRSLWDFPWRLIPTAFFNR